MVTASSMMFTEPHVDDPVSFWRQWASMVDVRAIGWKAVFNKVLVLGPVALDHVLPVLIRRARGRSKTEVFRLVAEVCAQREPQPATLFALLGETLNDSGSHRASLLDAMANASIPMRDVISLALEIATATTVVRPTGMREKQVVLAWRQRWTSCYDDTVTGSILLREWLQGERSPAQLDTALVFACAGAGASSAEHVRGLLRRIVNATGHASFETFCLLEVLSSSVGTNDGLPAVMTSAVWPDLFAHVRVLVAWHEIGPARMLLHLAQTLTHGADSIRTLRAAVELCVQRAWFGPGKDECVNALRDSIPSLLDAMVLRLPSTFEPVPSLPLPCGDLLSLLLGRIEADAQTHATCAPWLADDLRLLVLRTALSHPALGGVQAAMHEMESRGVPSVLVGPLREISRRTEDVYLRQHARQLARGERL